MIEIIASIIFIVSMTGVAVILYKKVPVLVELPQNGHHGLKKPEFIVNLEKKIKKHHFHFFEKQMFLHHLLSKTRIFVLKAESKIDHLLQDIRKKAQELEKGKRKKK